MCDVTDILFDHIDWPTICYPLYLAPACKIYYIHYNIIIHVLLGIDIMYHIIWYYPSCQCCFSSYSCRYPKNLCHSGKELFITCWSIILLCQVYVWSSSNRGVILHCFDESSVERQSLLPLKKFENCFTQMLNNCFCTPRWSRFVESRYTLGRKIYLGTYVIIERVNIVESLLRGTNFLVPSIWRWADGFFLVIAKLLKCRILVYIYSSPVIYMELMSSYWLSNLLVMNWIRCTLALV